MLMTKFVSADTAPGREPDDMLSGLLDQTDNRKNGHKSRGLSVKTKGKEIMLYNDCIDRVTNLADTIDMFEEIDMETQTFADVYRMLQERRDFD